MQDDIFCKIVKKEIPAHVVYETDDTLAFLDVTPAAPGHAMVILKKHGNNILEYTQEDLGKAMASVQVVAKKIETALQPDSITIGINHKEKRGVPHLHIHLIPRWENDKGHAIQGVVNNPAKEEVSIVAEKLRTA
jgi:histidine triad (HIT) family protein